MTKEKKKTTKSSSTKKTTKKVSTEEVVTKVEQSPAKKHKVRFRPYFGFKTRIVFNAIMFVLVGTLCFYAAVNTIEREKTSPITYTDVNNINYKVYLKNNNIYHDDYLGMNRAYVASLIDHIDIDFNYLFNIEKLTNMKFDYKIVANLIIENKNGTNYVDEEYIIKDTKTEELKDGGTFGIVDKVTINYNYYNDLTNKFRNETGVDTVSYLNVYLQVTKKTDNSLKYSIDETTKSNIKIPLSERALEIYFTSDQGAINKQTTPKGDVIFNKEYLSAEICLFILTCYFLVKTIKLIGTTFKSVTPYDKRVKKILKDYDRLIVETKTNLDTEGCKIIEVKSFGELLDVRDNLRLPIVYNVIVAHEKGVFYIKNNMDIYRFVLKGIDLKK